MDHPACQEFIIGVVSDTHIPDRVLDLHPDLILALKAEGVGLILHAGDISSPHTLERLAEAAPVIAVQGNRDFISLAKLPAEEDVRINGVHIYLAHGHGTFLHYLWDKCVYALIGYEFDRYRRFLSGTSQGADVVVYGHTHRPENRMVEGTMFFNPGSAGPNFERLKPSFGTLRVDSKSQVVGNIHYMNSYRVRKRRWLSDSAGQDDN
jgi:hypothetical protein